MKQKKLLICVIVLILSLSASVFAMSIVAGANSTGHSYTEQYRPQLSFSPKNNWNNDPNGLLYADTTDDGIKNGTYHMYYQYATTGNAWDTMHWGHATSSDLVHWQEQEIAILPNMPGWENFDGSAPSGPIFSGSAVYVSQKDIAAGKQAYNGAGFYAIFTQPNQQPAEGVGDQRQCIAWSADGNKYEVSTFKEIVPNDYDSAGDGSGKQKRGDFRDPKVFWDEDLQCWNMVVGGGEIVQFVSDNLLDWSYLGTSGLWGECPDMFKLTEGVGGEQKWVMVLSPEDKKESHEYNKTNRTTHEYPNEFYALGMRNENGLFVPDSDFTLQPLAFGIDSYAVQTFNGMTDSRRVGISWAANWKTTGDYALKNSGGLRDNWNGGMTMAYTLELVNINGEYKIAKNPVKEFENLRKDVLTQKSGITLGGENALSGLDSNLAEIDLTLDVTDTAAKQVTLKLAVSQEEETVIKYDIAEQKLIIDRSKSSLAASDTSRYKVVYSHNLVPQNGKVKIKAYLDYGNVSVFGGSGEASANVAIFPSLSSCGMSLTADGDITADVKVYSLKSIWNNEQAMEDFQSFYLSAKEKTLNVGESFTLMPCSPSSSFDKTKVVYTVTEGDDVVLLDKSGENLKIKALIQGIARIQAEYSGHTRSVLVNVKQDNTHSDLNFSNTYAGQWHKADGYVGASAGDGFAFSKERYKNFTLSATITSDSGGAQAAGIVFAASDNFYNYYCANYDYKEKAVKLWMSGGETIASAPLSLRRGQPITYFITVNRGDITIAVNGETLIKTSHSLFEQGYIGLNVFGGTFIFDDIKLSNIYSAGETPSVNVGENTFIVENITDKTYLAESDYTVTEGVLAIREKYIKSLTSNRFFEFSVMLTNGERINFGLQTAKGAEITESYKTVQSGNPLSVVVTDNGTNILSVLLNGKEVEFTFEKSRIIVSSQILSALKSGDYTIKIITDNGALEYVFGYEYVPPVPKNITGKVISIIVCCTVGAALLGFCVYWFAIARKRNKA